jgi:signal peptidase complex subunit 2
LPQAFEDAGFGEDHNLSNLKLALGTIACALALVAQFWPNPLKPMPFPDSRPLLLVCCVLYFLLSFILQLITTFYEKDTILYTVPPGPESSFHQALQGKRIKVSTRLNRFSIDYTLKFEVVDASGNTVVTDERVLKLTDYFEEKGAFHEDFFMVLLPSPKLPCSQIPARLPRPTSAPPYRCSARISG